MAVKKMKLSRFRCAGLDRFSDFGLLLIRVGLGLVFAFYHGWPKLVGGPDEWRHTGRAVSYLGLHGGYVIWGFLAMLTEFAGGVCLMLGFLARPAALALTVEMMVAAIWTYYPFHSRSAAHPLELAIVFLGLFFVGPGKYSVDGQL